jgi:hypothetical protein
MAFLLSSDANKNKKVLNVKRMCWLHINYNSIVRLRDLNECDSSFEMYKAQKL